MNPLLRCFAFSLPWVAIGCGSDPAASNPGVPNQPGPDGGDAGPVDAPTDALNGGDADPVDAPTDGLHEGAPDALEAGPSDPCGGCEPGSVCDPVSGCIDCSSAAGCPDVVYASPAGSGASCTFLTPCTLEGARDKVRTLNTTMKHDVLVYLRGGSYELAAPFALTQVDSGRGGHDVVYRAFPSERPVLSGGTKLTGAWTLVDPVKRIYRTNVGPGATSRQLYVAGRRAVRARGPRLPAGWTETATGYTTTDPSVQTLAKPSDLEVVGFRYWKNFRCAAASISGGAVTMTQPCWANANSHQGNGYDYTMTLPEWVENALEFLDEDGEFYLDSATGDLSYKPRDGEDMATVQVVLPRLEVLLSAEGTLDAPVQHIRFERLVFSYGTWLRPSTAEGYACLQSGVTGVGASGQEKTPANVSFRAATNISLVGNSFLHLGGAGLSFDWGSQDNEIGGNRFEDISGIAITIGDVTHSEDHHPTDPRTVVKNHSVHDNFITGAGAEYFDSPGIWAGYTDGTVLEHNDLFFLPYTGISVGWGWGGVDPPNQPTPSACRNNRIERNRVSWHMRVLEDGGGIYVLGAQPNSTIVENLVLNQGNNYGALYLDNGTQYYTVTKNVVAGVPYWLLVQPGNPKALNNTVTGNWHDADNPFPTAPDPSNNVSGNVVTAGNWPAEAIATMWASGLRAPWKLHHPDNVAAGKPSTASSLYDANYPASHANDEYFATGWSSLGTDTHAWWQVDLGNPVEIARVEVIFRWELDQPETRRNLEVRGSDDPTFNTFEVLGTWGNTGLPHQGIWAVDLPVGKKYRFIRVTKTKSEYFYLSEVRVLSLG
jgi:hypothetical protein